MGTFFKYFAIASFVALFSIIFQAYHESGSLQNITFQLQALVQLESNHNIISKDDKPRVVVAYGSCSDLTVRAVDVLNYTGNLKDFQVRDESDDEIHTFEDFMRSFMYYFSKGAAAERYTPNKELFRNIVAIAKKHSSHRWDLGGNAPVMGKRFHLEGAQVLIASTMSVKQRTHLDKGIDVVDFIPSEDFVDDIHLIFEYKTGDKFGDHLAPRANRYIIHNDENNPMITSLELLNVNKYNPKLFVVSGLQMLDNFPFKSPSVRKERLQGVKKQMTESHPDTLIHFEMASFVEIELMTDLLENVIPYADSLGMNEQEVDNLMHVLETGKISLSADSNPRVATTLDQMRKVFKILNRSYYEHRKNDVKLRMISRIHIHTLAFQLMMNVKASNWKNIKNAAAKSSLTAHRHVCQTSYVNPENTILVLDDSFATSAETPAQNTDKDMRPKRIEIKLGDPVPCWNETISVDEIHSVDVEICLSPVLVCREARKTVGAGDNISAAGLILQI
ncbi:CLUMA_CG004776, isoform A [Clunio marinus]|uniref:CLUMA_CG004776, isoform A n=1 Tax=Clunio marinus TaxID=568069 RepID=A0A1J1HSN9_9DIPT|nr:CLUMA_CG004776, isoform A [Clunio marinus]